MGYTTDFDGQIKLSRKLTEAESAYLRKFCEVSHYHRDPATMVHLPDPEREAVGLPLGPDCAYYVGTSERGIVDRNRSPREQPGDRCQWCPTDDDDAIEHDSSEKFYDYVEWMKYIIHHFIAKWGIVANGEIRWRGESFDDIGTIVVKNNEVTTIEGQWPKP